MWPARADVGLRSDGGSSGRGRGRIGTGRGSGRTGRGSGGGSGSRVFRLPLLTLHFDPGGRLLQPVVDEDSPNEVRHPTLELDVDAVLHERLIGRAVDGRDAPEAHA